MSYREFYFYLILTIEKVLRYIRSSYLLSNHKSLRVVHSPLSNLSSTINVKCLLFSSFGNSMKLLQKYTYYIFIYETKFILVSLANIENTYHHFMKDNYKRY